MTTFEFNSVTCYIDNQLASQFDSKVVPDLQKKDMDCLYIMEGGERNGKSRLAQIIGAYISLKLNSKFDLSNICMTPTEFRHKILTAEKNECIIYDEAHRGMASARALSEVNTILKDLMMEMGQRNLFIVIVLPSFFLLDKYVALFRSRGMFHVYLNKGKRGYWVYYNQKNKLRLYLKGKKEFNYHATRWPKFRGRFLDQFPIPEAEYNAKKAASFGGMEKDMKKTGAEAKEEQFKKQRDDLIYLWYKESKLSGNKFIEHLKTVGWTWLSLTQLKDIIRKGKEKYKLFGQTDI